MDDITITQNAGGSFDVKQGDKYADGVTYEEMLGLIAGLTMPEKKPCIHWMKTTDEHNAWRNRFVSS